MYEWEIQRLQRTTNARYYAYDAMQDLGKAAITALKEELQYNEDVRSIEENLTTTDILSNVHIEWNEQYYVVYSAQYEQSPQNFDKCKPAQLTIAEVLQIIKQPQANVFAKWFYNYKKNNKQSYTDFVESHKTKTTTL